ncbi:hypothetical protein GCK72_018269 [Caenorhabditis remanei]|uniref:DNA polymerase delta subunit 3 n=1 Tax=Caenorhabditis remanei TaxID=31234 RepID=A0A6A5GAQ3_CAERE|nr:hypothetical protein GCK72_018269 [Caenorhabditis remanei]KAF1751715.1 hypothetical protein GCK72_018269 [Caenorhabditis remanei]
MVEKYTTLLDDVCDPLTVRKFTEMSSLSRKEAISVLEKYIEAKGDPVWALYEITGIVDSSEYSFLPAGEKMIKHVVVPGSALEETKKTFSEVISTCLHSVQRTNPNNTRVYGRSWANNDDLKGKTLPSQEIRLRKSVSPAKDLKKEKSAEPEQKLSSSSASKPVAEAKKSTIVPLKKQANISSMFAKKPEKKTEKAEKSVSPPPKEEEKKTRKRPKIEVDEPEEPEEELEIVNKKDKTPVKKVHDSDEFPSSREQSVEKEKSPPAKRQKKGVNDENKKAKKRLIVPDSDDEEVQERMDVEEKKVKIDEKPKKPEDRRRTTRIEKVVETFVDEDGYLVSKEIQKTVECSPQKSPEKVKAKVISAPVPGAAKVPKKNSTITSFFKKA